MRLIDADALHYIMEDTEKPKQMDHIRRFMVDKAPTIDAEPIRHGHWIPVNPDMYRAEYFECSVCGMYSRDGLFRKELGYEYCPNCGAKMDEV